MATVHLVADSSDIPLTREDIVDTLREAILDRDFVPGQRMIESDLCHDMRASRGSVRSALMQLAREGLVEYAANRGARVRHVSLTEALHIAETRMVIEGLCVSRAAERITDADILELREYGRRLARDASDGDVDGFAGMTRSIFECYVRIADQVVAKEILDQLRARNERHRYRLTYRPERAAAAAPYWLAIVEAICQRDPHAAHAALHRHANDVKEAMKALA